MEPGNTPTKRSLPIPSRAAALLKRLNSHGFAAYIVGGCVRDSLLGRAPADWDITTSALPEEICACFADYPLLLQGMKHGTVTVMADHSPFEITTFRTESGYSDHRHPDAVSFTPSLREDLSRRDFTVNAMAYHPEEGLWDPFGGQTDLADGIIQCVGEPSRRFEEDALRILRALRFACRYGFSIETDTAKAILDGAPLLQWVSPERRCSELREILTAQNTRIFSRFAPVFGEAMGLPSEHLAGLASAADRIEDAFTRLTVLTLSIPAGELGAFLDGLRWSRREQEAVLSRRMAWDVLARTDTPDWVALILSHGEEALSCAIGIGNALTPDKRWSRWAEALARTGKTIPCKTVGELAVTGRDLLKIGVPPSKELGHLLQTLLLHAARGEVSNEREALLHLAGELRKT